LDLPKEDPMRVWAETTIAMIDDHGQKEMLGDGFERSEAGRIWTGDRDAGLGAEVHDGILEFDGPLSARGSGEVWVKRLGAVPHGKNFLAVGCKLRLGDKQPRGEGFGGLRIEMQRGAGRDYDLRVQLGVHEGNAYVMLEETREEPIRKTLDVGSLDVRAWQDLELRVVPTGDQGRKFTLHVSWNGVVVMTHELKTLGGNTGNVLETVLFASGRKGGRVDYEFDDYRL